MRILSRISIRAVGHFLAAKELRNNKKKHKMVEEKKKRDTVVYVRFLLECVFFLVKEYLRKETTKNFTFFISFGLVFLSRMPPFFSQLSDRLKEFFRD